MSDVEFIELVVDGVCRKLEMPVRINGVEFRKIPGIKYRTDWYELVWRIKNRDVNEVKAYREVLQKDLWAWLAFVQRVPMALINHPFVVDSCKDVEDGPETKVLYVWARGHFKTTIISEADTLRYLVNHPEDRQAIFSYTRPLALKVLRDIKQIAEGSDFVKYVFPDVFFMNPKSESPKWSEEVGAGLTFRRSSFSKECTVEAYGLTEGMPTGSHFNRRIYDDVVTEDLVQTPEMVQRVKDNFDMSLNLGPMGDGERDVIKILGTFYRHDDALVYIKGKKRPNGKPLYHFMRRPATEDGTFNGAPVFISQEKLDELKGNVYMFACQQLCDPTPMGQRQLNVEGFKRIDWERIPKHLYKFMIIDPAGMQTERRKRGDCWAIGVIGVEPYRDDKGASNIYLLDCVIEPFAELEAMEGIVNMYCRNGRIISLGVEKVALSTAEIHIRSALRAKGKYISIENKSLVLLSPAGRPKARRIAENLCWPLENGKVWYSSLIEPKYVERIKAEMEKFPLWHDDGLDMLSYVYDVAKVYTFPVRDILDVKPRRRDAWDSVEEVDKPKGAGWLLH